jgi:anaerobic selenocysteine-containing dehydrogenase
MNAISISESTFPFLPAVRSCCRICTSVCGILVDVEGDDAVGGVPVSLHPA